MIRRHPALQHIDYYWRFETGTEYVCPLDFDPFQYMYDHQKKLSFSMALYEYEETIPTLFTTVMEFGNMNPGLVQSMSNKNSLWHFIIDSETKVFNRCHFWSNFQVRAQRGSVYEKGKLKEGCCCIMHQDCRSKFFPRRGISSIL